MIVLEILNKDSHVTLAGRLCLLCTGCGSFQIHEQAMGGEDGINVRVM